VLNTIVGRLILAAAVLATALTSPAQPAAASHLHTIYVDGFGQGNNAAALRERVIERLNHSGQIKVAESASSSDAVLRSFQYLGYRECGDESALQCFSPD
jgi:hypothetical protein